MLCGMGCGCPPVVLLSLLQAWLVWTVRTVGRASSATAGLGRPHDTQATTFESTGMKYILMFYYVQRYVYFKPVLSHLVRYIFKLII